MPNYSNWFGINWINRKRRTNFSREKTKIQIDLIIQRILNLSQDPADFYFGFYLMIYSEWSFLNVHFVTSFTQIGVGAKLQSYLGVETNRASVPTEQLKVSKLNVLFVTSNHQFRFPPFFHNFFWVWAVEKEN